MPSAIVFWTALLLLAVCAPSTEASGIVRGVNLGGWLVTEPWITPSLYDSTNAVDEWTLCNQLGKTGCTNVLQEHWSSFYTRQDFADIKNAGLNSVRIPVGYWAVDVLDYEPYVSGQYPYLIQAVIWAKQLGLSVLIDLHGAPGSQNGQDNSGLQGPVLFMSNSSNVERSLGVLKNLTAEFSQDIYGGAVTGIELLNEPRLSSTFSMPDLKSFYANGSSVVQAPNTKWNTTIHDAFWGPGYWANYTPSANVSTALTLDTHQYYAFGQLGNLPHNTILQSICNMSQLLKQPTNVSGIPPTLVGEWSLETGQAPGTQPDGEDDQTKRTWLRLLFEAQLAAYEPRGPGQASVGWCFWSWKTQYDIDTWSYRLGLQNGWVPANVSDLSQRVFPVLKTGCVDASFNYTAAPDPPPWQGHGSSWNGAASSAGWNGGLEMLAGLVIVGSIFA